MLIGKATEPNHPEQQQQPESAHIIDSRTPRDRSRVGGLWLVVVVALATGQILRVLLVQTKRSQWPTNGRLDIKRRSRDDRKGITVSIECSCGAGRLNYCREERFCLHARQTLPHLNIARRRRLSELKRRVRAHLAWPPKVFILLIMITQLSRPTEVDLSARQIYDNWKHGQFLWRRRDRSLSGSCWGKRWFEF